MAKTDFDGKIVGLKRAVESNRSMWQKILDSNETKWRGQSEASNRLIASLKAEIDSLNVEWQTKYKEKERNLIDSNETCANLKSESGKLREQMEMKEQSLESLKKELQMRQQEFDTKLDEKDTNFRMLSAQVSSSQEECRILKSRLAEEQQRWDDVLQMKEKDFKVLQRELEQKAKDWEGQYQKEEQEIQIVRDGRRKLEQEVEEVNSRMRTQEIRAREQNDAKDDQNAALRKELQLREGEWKEKFKQKEDEVDSIRSQVEAYIREDEPKQAETPETSETPAISPAAENASAPPLPQRMPGRAKHPKPPLLQRMHPQSPPSQRVMGAFWMRLKKQLRHNQARARPGT